MRKAEEIRKRTDEIKKDFEEKVFQMMYNYIESIIDEESSVGWLYTYKRIPIDMCTLNDRYYEICSDFQDLPEFSDSFFFELNDQGNWKNEEYGKVFSKCLETLNEILKLDGWKVVDHVHWEVHVDETYDGYISFAED